MTTAPDLTLSKLTDALARHAAFRRVRRLQPVGGVGDKIFPPTYPAARQNDPPRHVFERRRVDGREAWCVLVDSVQSQANRLEEALLSAAGGDGLRLPYVTVDFSGARLRPLERITSLEAPHRVYDAILRDSLLDGEPLMQTDQGRRLAAAKPADATALLELSPTALLFGAWHSQGEGGGLGAKFPRALVSEIMAIDTPVDHRGPGSEPSSWSTSTGTLIATAESFINHAEAGHFTDELDNLLGVGTQDALRKLVDDGRLTRHKLAGQFLYCAADRAQQTHQVRARRLLLATPGLGQPLPDADLMPEQLRAAIVLFASLLDERQRRLFAGLEALKCGWGGDRRIARLLGIDPSTVAAGRRQLVERDVEVDRVRRAGGGRTPTEKKRRKSSPASKP